MISTPRRIAALGLPAVPPGSYDVLARRAMLGRIARLATFAALVVAALLVAGIIGLSLYAYSHSGRVYEGVKRRGCRRRGNVPRRGLSRDSGPVRRIFRCSVRASLPKGPCSP